MSYYDQMKPVEQDQEITRKAMEAFRLLVREYPESRYAADALAKIDICRGRLAQKELWVAAYYINQGNPSAARQRLDLAGAITVTASLMVAVFAIVKEALYRLGEVYQTDGRTEEAQRLFRQVAEEYPYTDWGRRAAQRLQTATR